MSAPATELREMSRLQFWSSLGKVSVVEPILVNSYAAEEDEIWRSGSEDSPHGHPWNTSFHASSFPGDDPMVCGRLQVYTMLAPPPAEPISPNLRAWFDLGKNLELDWVRRWAYYGVLLTADQTADDDVQTGFEDREHWLTGSSDAILLPPFWTRGHCVEVKTTKHEKVQAMLQGEPPPKSHEKYLRQLGAYIGLSHEANFAPIVMICDHSGLQLIPELGSCREKGKGHKGTCTPRIVQLTAPIDGTLIYSSREEPMVTASFFLNYDPEFMAAGRARLALWRDQFLRDEIPAHPREQEKAKWSVDPCQYCDLKKFVCKPDYTAKKTKLSESALKAFGNKIRPGYDMEAHRAAVLARWQIEEDAA